MTDSATQLRTTPISPLAKAHFWLRKRSDKGSRNWMVAWYDWGSRTARLVSTRTENRAKAEAFLEEFAAQNQHLVLASRERNRKVVQVVYFMETDDAIKIGVATDPVRRLAEIQKHHYREVRLLASCPGGVALERKYHARFAQDRIRGEWFERHPDILAEIDRLTCSEGEG